jgi:hypothetical protein
MANLGTSLGTSIGERAVAITELVDRKNLAVAKVSIVVNPPHKEADLERALWFLYQQWKLVGFRPRGLFQMFTPGYREYRGGIAAIQTALRQGDGSGFTFLNCRGKRQLSIESLVLREAWAHLFSDGDKRIARERLDGIAKGAGAERIDAG